MARVVVNYAHPGQQHSQINRQMAQLAQQEGAVTFVDLYAKYPRFNIDIDAEQDRLRAHDVIVFQFPLFWYSTPSLIKEWQDLVLEYGFAYGDGGDQLRQKSILLAITAGGFETSYQEGGSNRHELRTLLTPFEQTAHLCQMNFLPPYVLHSARDALQTGSAQNHLNGYGRLLSALASDQFDFQAAAQLQIMRWDNLPIDGQQSSGAQ